jgi:hypothetical protein
MPWDGIFSYFVVSMAMDMTDSRACENPRRWCSFPVVVILANARIPGRAERRFLSLLPKGCPQGETVEQSETERDFSRILFVMLEAMMYSCLSESAEKEVQDTSCRGSGGVPPD